MGGNYTRLLAQARRRAAAFARATRRADFAVQAYQARGGQPSAVVIVLYRGGHEVEARCGEIGELADGSGVGFIAHDC